MNKYYHFTTYSSLENINIEGLVPQTGIRCQSIGDDKKGVYFSKGIFNSIKMYAYMLGFYNKYNSEEGINIINEIQIELKKLEKLSNKRNMYKSIYKDKLIEFDSIMKRFNLIRSYGSFNDYLGGDGCFLCVSELENTNESVSENCCSIIKIPPSNINVVGIRNKKTYEYIDSREKVLSYFMNCVSLEVMLHLVDDDNKKNISSLYEYIANIVPTKYDINDYYLVEEPINSYDYKKQKVKH